MTEHAQHDHHTVSADADGRWLAGALALIVGFMAVEVVVGLRSGSLALLSDAGHMLTDAGAILLALIALRLAAAPPRGGFTYGLRRAEILSAQANGLTLLLLAGWLSYEAVRRLIEPHPVTGLPVLITALVGIVVNLTATWCISRAGRRSLNVEGAYQHILTDLIGFVATAVAAVVIMATGWHQADTIASLIVALLMVRAGLTLVRDSGRILLEAAPAGLEPIRIGPALTAHEGVVEVHDLHVWAIDSGSAAISAHVIVDAGADCHKLRLELERVLHDEFELTHTTLQVDHAEPVLLRITRPSRPD